MRDRLEGGMSGEALERRHEGARRETRNTEGLACTEEECRRIGGRGGEAACW